MQKHRFIFLFFIFVATLAQGEPEVQIPKTKNTSRLKISPKSTEDITKTANALRQNPNLIRNLLTQTLEKKLLLDFAQLMMEKNFKESDVVEVIDGQSFKDFSNRFINHPTIQNKINFYVQRLLTPGNIEASILQKKARLRALEIDNIKQTHKTLQASVKFRTKESVHTLEPPSFLKRLWDYLLHDLIKS